MVIHILFLVCLNLAIIKKVFKKSWKRKKMLLKSHCSCGAYILMRKQSSQWLAHCRPSFLSPFGLCLVMHGSLLNILAVFVFWLPWTFVYKLCEHMFSFCGGYAPRSGIAGSWSHSRLHLSSSCQTQGLHRFTFPPAMQEVFSYLQSLQHFSFLSFWSKSLK